MTRNVYQQHIHHEIPRLLSFLDREPFSPAYGCFDRLHWAWSAIDIANADLQKFTLPLTYVYQLESPDNPYFHHPEVLTWIEAAIRFCCKEQSRHGAFNQWLPNDNSIVAAGFVMHDLIFVLQLLQKELSSDTIKLFTAAAIRAGRMLVNFEELHGFNSNHHLANAVALLDISRWLDHPEATPFKDRALQIIKKVLARQSKSGAFYEYAGADPGYHTLGLAFLAACYEICPETFIFNGVKSAVAFSSHFISPVSGNGGAYGTRGTHLLYPSGFEIAAKYGIHPELPARIATIVAEELCVTPSNTDLTNLIPLMSDYTRTCLMPPLTHPVPPTPLPTQDFFCDETTFFSFPRLHCRIHGRLNGGMLMIHSTLRQKVLFASAGYMVEYGKKKGFSGVFDGDWKRSENILHFKAKLQQTNRIRLTPFKLMVLRSYFFLFGNLMPLNLFMKKLMAWLLIFKKKFFNLPMQRTIVIQDHCVIITDCITNHTAKTITLHHCKQGYIHFMGSARYFDSSWLRFEPAPSVRERKNQGPERTTTLDDPRVLAPGDQVEISFAVDLE